MRHLFIFLSAFLAAAAPASAIPSREDTIAFEASLAAERAAFEKENKDFSPGPAAKEIETFRKQEAARIAALDANTAGISLEAKKEAIASYQTQRRAAEFAFREKMNKLDASPVRARDGEAAFRRKQIELKQSFDQATATMPLAQKREAIAAYNAAVRADAAANTAALRKPIIAENLPDKRRAFERKMIEKQRAFYAQNSE